MKEQRQYYRLDTDLTAVFKKDGDADFIPARIINISVAGAYLRAEKPLRTGRQIELCFQLNPASKKKIICKGRIVWIAKFKGYHYGVEFANISRIDQYKIAGFINGILRRKVLKNFNVARAIAKNNKIRRK
jgi:c-di-GMP-binding flagellar brake protein YcgR